jgi:lipoprotein
MCLKKIITVILIIISFFSCKSGLTREYIQNAKYKSVSKLLKEAKDSDIHLDRHASKLLIEHLSQRSAREILSLNVQEKNEVLNIAITASIDIISFFKAVKDRFKGGKIPDIQNDSKLKKELLMGVDSDIRFEVIKAILSDYDYLKEGNLDSILFSMAIMLGKACKIVGYDITEGALKDGTGKDVIDLISKTNIEVALYSYGIVSKRDDIQTIAFAGVKLIELLPKMKTNY